VSRNNRSRSKDSSDDIELENNLNPLCIYLFLNFVKSYVDSFNNVKKIYMVWDKKILWPSTNFRKKTLENTYKANRDKSNNVDVYSYESALEQICLSLGIVNMYPYVLEADDVISWLTTQDKPNMVITADKDMLQLVNDDTSFYHITKKIIINKVNFEEHVGVPADAYLYYKAIVGDASDNIPGFPGYGKVRGKRLAISISKDNIPIENLNMADDYKILLEKNLMMCDLNNSWLREANELEAYQNQFKKIKNIKPDFNLFYNYCIEYKLFHIMNNIKKWEDVFTLERNSSNIIDVLM
jgi:5'-3' exonuclease